MQSLPAAEWATDQFQTPDKTKAMVDKWAYTYRKVFGCSNSTSDRKDHNRRWTSCQKLKTMLEIV